ncbi:transcriptional regulator [Pseudomonas phage DDSR119]|nr:transcriptional regulator [Pseudomonas phage DDSR119]
MREFEEFIRSRMVERRLSFDLSFDDIAFKTGVNRRTLIDFAAGRQKSAIKFPTLCLIAKWLDIEVVMSWRDRGSEDERYANVGA